MFDSSKAVSFQVPHNAAVQIYDFKSKKSRVQFGPELVSLVARDNPVIHDVMFMSMKTMTMMMI